MTKNKSNFNKIITVFMSICLCFLCFAGCSLWTQNDNKYENQVAARFGDTTVTLKEVYDAYYAYGNYYYDNQGDPTYEGMKKTAASVLNRKLIADYLKYDEKGKIELTTKQINDAWRSVYSSLNTAITKIEKTLIPTEDTPTDPDTPKDPTYDNNYERPYQTYKKTYEYVLNTETGEYELKKIETPEEEEFKSVDIYQWTPEELAKKTDQEKADRALSIFKDQFWDGKNHTQKDAEGNLYSEKAMAKYIAQLKAGITDKSLTKNSAMIFYTQVKKLYEDAYTTALISAFEANFRKTDLINEQLVLNTFSRLATTDRNAYSVRDADGKLSAYTKAMQTRSAPVIYYDHSTDWFQVAHVLLKFDADTVNQLKDLKSQLDNDTITEAVYNQKSAAIKNGVKFKDRSDEKGETSYTAAQVLSMLQRDLASAQTPARKLEIFNDYIYRFNMDDGINNAQLCYYIPTNPDDDTMVTPFANKSRELREQGVGSISNLVEISEIDGYIDNKGEKQTPSYSGYHIVVYTGEIQTLDTATATVADLDAYVLNPLNNNQKYHNNKVTGNYSQTMLDYVIEKISYDHYSAYQNDILNNIKGDKDFTYVEGVLKELVKVFSKK